MIINLPAGLDLDSHLIEYPPIDFKNFCRDKLAYILFQIIDLPSKNKEILEIGGGWVPLYTPIIRNTIRNYSDYLKYALGKHYPGDSSAALLITDNHYILGEKSKWFRFADKYVPPTGELTQFELTDKKLVKQLNKKRIENNRSAKRLYPLITNWFNEGLHIDGDGAREYAGYLRDEELKQIAIEELQGMHTAEKVQSLRVKAYNKHLIYLNNISSIEKGDIYYSVDSTARRFHSNLTNLKKEFRNFLAFQGQQLVSIDIKNAQPFFSLALFNPWFYTSSSEQVLSSESVEGVQKDVMQPRPARNLRFSTVAPTLYKAMQNTKVSVPLPQPIQTRGKKIIKNTTVNKVDSLIMYSNSLQRIDKQDVVIYKQSVVEGLFYDSFANAVTSQEIGFNWSRKDAKKAMFRVFFTDNRYSDVPKELFEELYPTVFELFYKVKVRDKAALAVLLQSIESWLVLDVVCRRISRAKPDVPIFTIHDSIITTRENEAYVKEEMENAIQRHIGNKPSLDISYFTQENISVIKDEFSGGYLLLEEALSILDSQYVS